VPVEPREITVYLGGSTAGWHYGFRCPTCQRDARAYLRRSAGKRLVARGAHIVVELPTEASPARPFQPDDLIDFHELLDRDGWFEALLRGGPVH
jgi:hypothetical protein